MKQIKTKLRSRKGASMVIALVFMLFCACIGGVVLAAATANGGRLKGLSSDLQLSLREQSAVRILKNQLSGLDKMNLSINYVTKAKYTYEQIGPTGLPVYKSEPDETPETSVTIEAKNVPSGGFNLIQQVLLEKAVYKFLGEAQVPTIKADGSVEYNGITDYSTVTLKGFNFKSGTASTPNDFTLFPSAEAAEAQTSITIKDPYGYEIPVEMTCAEADEDYTFYISLGSDPRIAIQIPMVISEKSESEKTYAPEQTGSNYKIVNSIESFSINWFYMLVTKGGAVA